MKRYEPFEHTADIGLRIYGKTLKELLAHAGEGMFSLIVKLDGVKPRKAVAIRLTATSTEDLFINWLQELLFRFATTQVAFSRFTMHAVTPTSLKATARGERVDYTHHEIYREIKAVTYHGLSVKQTKKGWVAKVIFDI